MKREMVVMCLELAKEELEELVTLLQVIHFNDSGAPDRKSKPAGVQGMLLRVVVSATPPSGANPREFLDVDLVTKQNHAITFDPADKAKTAYYLACWYTAAGRRGPWSEIAQQLVA